MATQIGDLLDAMAEQITDQLGALVETYRIQIIPRHINSPTPPAIDMFPGDLSRGTDSAAFGTQGEHLFTVRARVNDSDPGGNQDLLLGFMDENNALGIAAALTADTTLGGLATSLDCIDPTGYVTYPFGDQSLIGFQFTCKVIRADS